MTAYRAVVDGKTYNARLLWIYMQIEEKEINGIIVKFVVYFKNST